MCVIATPSAVTVIGRSKYNGLVAEMLTVTIELILGFTLRSLPGISVGIFSNCWPASILSWFDIRAYFRDLTQGLPITVTMKNPLAQ